MDNNIHSHTHVMDEKYIFLLLMNKDNSDKIFQHLFEMEKVSPPPGPPPLQSSISMAISQDNDKLGKSINVCSKDKGMQTQVCRIGHKSTIVYFLSPVRLL